MIQEAGQLREYFNLIPHPEGGFYTRTYHSNELIQEKCLPERFGGTRYFSSAIYYLLEDKQYSSFHRLLSDELWHFYAGSPLNLYIIDNFGNLKLVTLGNNFSNGEVFQTAVKHGNWLAAQPALPNNFSFVGCTVSPGFDFNDIEYADPHILTLQFPQHEKILYKFCR